MGYTVIELKSKEQWIKALEDVNHSYFHTWEYCNAVCDSGFVEPKLLLISLDCGFVITTFCIRSKEEGFLDIYTPYGFGGFVITNAPNSEFDHNQFYTIWDAFGRENDLVSAFIMTHPSFPINADVFPGLVKHHIVFNLDLTNSEDKLWSKLPKGHKYEIKKVNADQSIQIVYDKKTVFPIFLKLYFETMKRVGASDVYFFNEQFLKKLVDYDNSMLLGAEKNGSIEAIVLFLFSETIGEYFISAASQNHQSYTKALIWSGILELKKNKVKMLNLGGGVKEGDSLESFKKRFGGDKTELYVLKYIFNDSKFEYLCTKFNTPQLNNKFFPPYWAKSN